VIIFGSDRPCDVASMTGSAFLPLARLGNWLTDCPIGSAAMCDHDAPGSFRYAPAARLARPSPPCRVRTFGASFSALCPGRKPCMAGCRPTPVSHRTHMDHPSVVSDCFGTRWRVAQALPTVHGWPLYRGRPLREDGTTARQGPAVVPTAELREHLAVTIDTPYDVDLPVSRPVVSRLRRALGLSWRPHRRQWWEAREGDLEALTEEEFAAKHGVAQSAVSHKLRKSGRLRRPRKCLDDVGLRQLLSLPISHNELAGILDVSRTTVARWRSVVAAQAQAGNLGG
jgi:hypothetical protein